MIINKKTWLIWFIVLVTSFGFFEYISIVDGNEDTYTLTSAVINYVPQWLFWTAIIPFLLWFIHHFYTYYKKLPTTKTL